MTRNGDRMTFSKEEGGGFIDMRHSASNCKLTLWEYSQYILGYPINEERAIAKIKIALKESRILVYINTTHPTLKKILKENFEIYQSVSIPIGYNHGYQYHIFLRNSIGLPNPNMRPSEYKKEVTLDRDGVFNKQALKVALATALKKRRRKTDVVNEIVDSL